MQFKETDDIWRLYVREWVTVHTISMTADDGRPAFEAARTWVADNLTGRVRDTDVNLTLNTDLTDRFWCHVQVFKDNLKGEFKHVENAQAHATRQGFDEYVIVPRNSKSDHDIRNYGVIKL
jgi:hypothetical protein